MAYKDSTAERTTITRSLKELESSTGNVYETITVLSKRSNQINIEMKEELNQKLDEFAKSGAIAIQELEQEKLFWKSPENEGSSEEE